MTKSGIGTTTPAAGATTPNGTIGNGVVSSSNTNGTNTAIAACIAQAEIPVWVADKKKWVTGISKKTTVNDLIHAILKQCQIAVLPSSHEQLAQYVLVEFETSSVVGNDVNVSSSSLPAAAPNPNEQTQQSQQVINAQKIIDGDSKVYKYLSRWLQSPSTNNSQILLKILQRQPIETSNSDNNHNANTTSQTQCQQQHHNHTSLTSKILKKFGVSHHSNSTVQNQTTTPTVTQTSAQPTSSLNTSYRYVDVKLPKSNTATVTTTTTSGNVANTSSSPPQSTASHTSSRVPSHAMRNSFDPNVQKSFVYTTILERENRLKQQRERFQLIDEMIKEHERKSRLHSNDFFMSVGTGAALSTNNLSANTNHGLITSMGSASTSSASSISPPAANKSSQSKIGLEKQQSQLANEAKSSGALNIVDLNDIYCYFPEMCTHQLNEVQDFTQMCSKLFDLDENIQTQRQMLSALECDLQRELNSSSQAAAAAATATHAQCMSPVPATVADTPEMAELRKEVTLSREQTRLQCKQLHDLDAKMRSNEHNLMMREHELQQLLEELYIQEIYADNALEKAITSHDQNPNQNFFAHSAPAISPANFHGKEAEEAEEERLLFVDSEHRQVQNHKMNSDQTDAVELKIHNSSSESHDKEAKFDADASYNYNYPHFQHAPPPPSHHHMQHYQHHPPYSTNSQYLSAHQKSLSYGNLHHPTVQMNTEPLNDVLNSQHQQKTLSMLAKSVQNGVGGVGGYKYLKTSPSLEFNKLASAGAAVVYLPTKINGLNPSGTMPNINGHDHSGDNDSGISSMSSETTSGIGQKPAPPPPPPMNVRNTTPTSLQIINSNAASIAGHVSIPILTSAMAYDQYQVFARQQQQYSQEQLPNQVPKSTKSVLETLV